MAEDEAGERGLGQIRQDLEEGRQFPFSYECLEKPLEEFCTVKATGD